MFLRFSVPSITNSPQKSPVDVVYHGCDGSSGRKAVQVGEYTLFGKCPSSPRVKLYLTG